MSNPWTIWLDAARLSLQAQCVIALRMMRLAQGGALAAREAHRMVAEKVIAGGEAQAGAFLALASHAGDRAVRRAATRPYRRAICANRRRLVRRI